MLLFVGCVEVCISFILFTWFMGLVLLLFFCCLLFSGLWLLVVASCFGLLVGAVVDLDCFDYFVIVLDCIVIV